jgi:hypothetical protein
MCSTNFASSTWLRRASVAGICLLLVTVPALGQPGRPRGTDIDQAWLRLTQGLENGDLNAVKEHSEELLHIASELGLKRLTPMALALVAHSRTQSPALATGTLRLALRLDPQCPEAHFALASASLRSFSVITGVGELALGTDALFKDRRLAHVVNSSVVLALLVGLLVALSVLGLASIQKVVPLLWHDLMELGAYLRIGPNGPVMAVFLLMLPLFAGGDPAWALLWLFALCWAYFSWVEKALGVLGLLLVAAAPTLLESASRDLTHPPNAIWQATYALEERRYAPQALTDLAALSDVFDDDAEFDRLLGDAYRQMGLLDSAAGAYREGLRLRPKDPATCLSLGAVHFGQGDFNAALQVFQVARDVGADPVIANYDLALTYKQTFHFPESDSAMEAASRASARRLAEMTRGDSHEPIVLPFTEADAMNLISRKDPIMLLNRGLLPPPLLRERTLTHPLAIAAMMSLLIALAHFLLRQRLAPLASACMKCGRAFCQLCKLSSESQTYCTQCVNIFLKKDMVAIEMQLAKRRQLAARHKLHVFKVRALDLLLPGIGLTVSGKPLSGLPLALVSLLSCAALVWFSLFLGPALLHVTMWPMGALCVLCWLAAAVTAQVLPRERR